MTRFLVGVDIGGTFTDCAVVDRDGRAFVGKVLTTYDDLSRGFFDSIEAAMAATGEDAAFSDIRRIAHGTTVGINAIVTRRGARVGLLATSGHGDAIRIMDNASRVAGTPIEHILDYSRSTQAEQFLRRDDIIEIPERVDTHGEIVVGLNEDAVRAAVTRLVERGVDAIAVSYLWSFLRPEHEQRTREIIEEMAPGIFVSCGHDVAPKLGEYPRTATAVLNAYIGPSMNAYVDRIVNGAAARGYNGQILFSHCEGGLISPETARHLPILTLQSGPVGGVVASAVVGETIGQPNIITTDMGGTTLDVSVIHDGKPAVGDLTRLEQHELFLRKVDVESVGAGGGSIAWIDERSRTLRVGPQSASSTPGPACYGRGGTQPTVTDADVVLGILNPQGVLGGGLKLNADAAWNAVESLGKRLGMTAEQCAAGIIEIVDNHMEDLVRRVTLQRGFDPREFALWAFGGGAGAHATLYARGLGVPTVVVPINDLASVWSAYGIAKAALTRTREEPTLLESPFTDASAHALSEIITRLEERLRAEMVQMDPSIDPATITFERTVDMKYAMQVFEVETAVPSGPIDTAACEQISQTFEHNYEVLYGPGSGYREAGFAITSVRVVASAPWEAPEPVAAAELEPATPASHRPVFWYEHGTRTDTPIYDGHHLGAGARIEGPGIVEYPDTTVVVRPGQSLRVDAIGNLLIDVTPAGTSGHDTEEIR
jgi:N-methylhydantoinase A